ncbi:MAG: flagella basal body P-ring formation protein FlgA [Phycisphaerales bacterium]
MNDLRIRLRDLRHGTGLRLAVLALLGATCGAIAGAAAADTVRLLPSVRIAPGSAFTLADIADLDGPEAESLAGTTMGRGETGAFELSAERIRQQLVVAGGNPAKLEFIGTRTVVRPLRAGGEAAANATATTNAPAAGTDGAATAPVAQAVDGMRAIDPAAHAGTSSPLAIICEILRNAYGEDACDLRLRIAEETLARIAPKPGARYEVVKKSSLRGPRVELEVVERAADGEAARTRVRVEVRFEREVLVARNDLRRGGRADGGAAAIERRMLTPDEARTAADPHAVASDATFARAVPRGGVVEREDLTRPEQVKRRDVVKVRREIGAIAIEIEAVALEDGAVGDVIAFEHHGRRRARDAKAFTAEITGPGEAVIR